jgi:hypothetical protein
MLILLLTLIGLIASLAYNVIQYRWRQQDRRDHAAEKTERDKKELKREAEQRRREEAPPEFYNIDGTSAPIRINGMRHEAVSLSRKIFLGNHGKIRSPKNWRMRGSNESRFLGHRLAQVLDRANSRASRKRKQWRRASV